MGFTFIVQTMNLPPEPLDLMERLSLERFRPDPWTYHPWEYNPFNDRETLVEALVIWLGVMYGFFRIINIMRIIREDDQERAWEYFWRLCE